MTTSMMSWVKLITQGHVWCLSTFYVMIDETLSYVYSLTWSNLNASMSRCFVIISFALPKRVMHLHRYPQVVIVRWHIFYTNDSIVHVTTDPNVSPNKSMIINPCLSIIQQSVWYFANKFVPFVCNLYVSTLKGGCVVRIYWFVC